MQGLTGAEQQVARAARGVPEGPRLLHVLKHQAGVAEQVPGPKGLRVEWCLCLCVCV